MADYTYTDADWRENAKHGLVGVTADDATEHWDRWLTEHDAKVRAEAMQEAAAIIAALRPTGLAALARPGMRSRDAILWEAQSAVQRSAREIEKGAGS